MREVGLVVPLNDLELPVLAAARGRFAEAGIVVMVSSPEVVDVCYDKWKTALFLARNGLDGPQTFLEPGSVREAVRAGRLKFPLVLKPRWGSGSVGVERVEDQAELEQAFALGVHRRRHLGASMPLVIQEQLEGIEHGLDVVQDFEGGQWATFVRRKDRMRAGETERAEVVSNQALEATGQRLGLSLRHGGMLDCDVFLDGTRCRVLELNPRFGGGYPFVHVAGADLPAFYLALVEGREVDPGWLRVRIGTRAAKCDRLVGLRRPASAVDAEQNECSERWESWGEADHFGTCVGR
jgi:carbamoyl-phosphate synthase large subunit